MKRYFRLLLAVMIISSAFCFSVKKTEAKALNGDYHMFNYDGATMKFSGKKLYIKGWLIKGLDYDPVYNKYIKKKFPLAKKVKYYVEIDEDMRKVSKKRMKKYLKKSWDEGWIDFKKGKVIRIQVDFSN